MRDTPIATYSRSRLREPEVLEAAARRPVEITTGRDTEPLVLLSKTMFHARSEVSDLTATYLRVIAAMRLPDAPRVLLGEVAFIGGWQQEARQRFVDGFGEALAESVRTGDPAPARFFLDVNQRAVERPTSTSPAFTGEVSEDASAAIEAHLSARR